MGGGLLDRVLRVIRRFGNGFTARNSIDGEVGAERLTWDSRCSCSSAKTLEMKKKKLSASIEV
jgi:hypothetical protein